jgi:tetratricopeptide (TPR) repeat protein
MQETRAFFLGDDGVWKVNTELQFEELPDEVEKLIDLRISQLEIDLRRKLEIASVEGEEFTTYVIAKLDGTEERRLLEQLSSELDRKLHLVSPSRSLALQDRRIHMYRFKHALFQKFIYNRLDKPRRESLHRDIGEFIEVIYGEDVPQVASLLAEHFHKGELPEKEIQYRLIAAQEAQRVGSTVVALEHLKRLETILTDPDASVASRGASLKQLYDLRGHIYARIPEPEQAHKDLQQLEILAHQEQNMYYVARAFYGYGVLERALGRFDRALEFVKKVEAMELQEAHPGVVADSRLLAAKTCKDLAVYQDAAKWAESAQTIYEKLNNRIGILDSRSQIAYAHYAQGQYPEAEKIWMNNLLKAPKLAHLPPDPDDDVYFCLGFLNWRLMRYEKARESLLKALRSAEQMEYVRKKAYCLNNLGGLVEASLGNFAEAEMSLKEAIEVFEKLGDKKGLCWAWSNMGNVLMQTGRIPEAITNLQKSQEFATEIGLKSSQAESSRRISWAYLKLSDLSEAYRYANIALQEAEEIGRRAFVGKAYHVLGEIAIEAEKTSELVTTDLKSPEHYLERSLQIAQETQNSAEEIEILRRLGNYLMGSDDPSSQSRGQEFIQRANSLHPQNDD